MEWRRNNIQLYIIIFFQIFTMLLIVYYYNSLHNNISALVSLQKEEVHYRDNVADVYQQFERNTQPFKKVSLEEIYEIGESFSKKGSQELSPNIVILIKKWRELEGPEKIKVENEIKEALNNENEIKMFIQNISDLLEYKP